MSFFDGLSVLSNWCRGEGVASRGCLCELEQVVGRADHRPFASDLIKTPEKELSETSGVFDLTEHRLDDLLAQSISAAAPSDSFRYSSRRLLRDEAGPRRQESWRGPERPCSILQRADWRYHDGA